MFLQPMSLFSTGNVHLEKFHKNEDRLWILNEYKRTEDIVTIDLLKFELAMTDVYLGVYAYIIKYKQIN